MMRRFFPLSIALIATLGCDPDTLTPGEPVQEIAVQRFGVVERPAGFPAPDLKGASWPSEASFELGRALFYEKALSGNQTQSCASCHEQARGFAEPKAYSVGSTGVHHVRNASSLVNVVYNSTLTWADSELTQLEEQIRIPLFSTAPVEMGAKGHEEEILDRLRADPRYRDWFAAAYPEDPDPVSWEHIIASIAGFVRSLVSGASDFDRFVYQHDATALTASQQRGMALFFSERLECHHCHGNFNFTASTTHAGSKTRVSRFHNTGLYNVDGEGAYPAHDQGLMQVTGQADDMGRFRAPTLRNVEVSGPYMHDGSIATLEEVIRFYEAGGRALSEGPLAGDGRKSPLKSGFVPGFELSDQERSDLLDFLRSLTDPQFLSDPRFSDPHPRSE